MTAPTIREAEAKDAGRLNAALAALTAHLGDRHAASDADIERAGWGETPLFRAVIAEDGADTVGAALYWPIFSTVLGGPGLYISDLWVAERLRGSGLGRRLLGEAAADAERRWGAGFLKLAVHDHNGAARAAYLKMGFAAHAAESNLLLDADGLKRLRTG